MNTVELFLYVAVANVAIAITILVLLIGKITRAPFDSQVTKHLKKHKWTYIFAISGLSTAGSLYLSEISKIAPCFLCWLQRASMYPLALYSGLHVLKKTHWYQPILTTSASIILFLGLYVLPAELQVLYSWYALSLIPAAALYFYTKPQHHAAILALAGLLIATYHYVYQRVGFLAETIPCSATSSCNTIYLGYWGFYSIPLLALVSFASITYMLYAAKKEKKQ